MLPRNLLLIFLVLMIPAALLAGEPKAKKGSGTWSEAAAEPEVTGSARADLAPGLTAESEAFRRRGDGPSRRDFRRMGLTARNLRPIVAEMKANGEWDSDQRDDMVHEVTLRWLAEHPRAIEKPNFSIDDFLAFIESIMPLILLLIQLFGGS